jgi:gliding motility-associated-like protein
VNGGSGNFEYFWGNIQTPDSTLTIGPLLNPQDTVFSCIVFDLDEQCLDVIVFNINVPTPILNNVTISGDTMACENAVRVIQALVVGGSGGFQYFWGSGPASTSYTDTIPPPAPEFITLTVKDTITGCEDNPIVQNLPFYIAPEADFDIADTLCAGQEIEIINLSDTTGCTRVIGYRWFLNGIDKSELVVPNFNANDTGFTEIKLLILDSLCSDSAMRSIPTYPYNPINASVITQEDRFTEIRLGFPDDAVIDSCIVYWGDGDTTYSACELPDDRHYFDEYGRYEIEVSYLNTDGCKINEILEVNVIPEIKVYFPKAFSPDGDGVNDTFGPVSDELDKVQGTFNVYNRRGQIIFTTSDPEKVWDGTVNGRIASEGIYHYSYVIRPIEGAETNFGTVKGYFALIK